MGVREDLANDMVDRFVALIECGHATLEYSDYFELGSATANMGAAIIRLGPSRFTVQTADKAQIDALVAASEGKR